MTSLCIEIVCAAESLTPDAIALRPGAVVDPTEIVIGAGPGVAGQTAAADLIIWRDVPDAEAQAAYDAMCAWMRAAGPSARHLCVRMLTDAN